MWTETLFLLLLQKCFQALQLFPLCFVLQFGISYSPRSPSAFNVPHALALAQDKDLLCVADRENSRVQCFKVQ